MRQRPYWILVATGLALDAGVMLLPLTPYPVVQRIFDSEYFEVHRGYEQFQETGIWKSGDAGFELMRRHYMTDVVRGLRPELDSRVMEGLRLEVFQVAETEAPTGLAEQRPVYVIYSNQQGHEVDGEAIKVLTSTFRKPYAMLVSLGLLAAAAALTYQGLAGLWAARLSAWEPRGSGPAENSLSRNMAS